MAARLSVARVRKVNEEMREAWSAGTSYPLLYSQPSPPLSQVPCGIYIRTCGAALNLALLKHLQTSSNRLSPFIFQRNHVSLAGWTLLNLKFLKCCSMD